MHDIKRIAGEVKSLIEQKVFHPYLLQHINAPVIDEDKLLLLVSRMEGLSLSNREQKNYALTAMLVQIALDTHEHVTNKIVPSDLKERQLTVLAGDYYSGLYYKHLADTDDIQMIRALAKGIREVNENKTLFYQKQFPDKESLLESIMNIEASLLARFSDYFGRTPWTTFVEGFLLLKRLLNERKLYSEQEKNGFYEAMELLPPDFGFSGQAVPLIETLDRWIAAVVAEVKTRAAAIPDMNSVLKNRLDEMTGEIGRLKIFVEEG
ncbi:heptaprenyl diphosphate synthase component 1 [Bacillus sp. FJAT-27225]|uniref:heptaprenyl diphosphate synthase component 1 n=1 Tax=Bacillus sp. FJAT-27225 TaxID=1743144 RepID=UPI000AEAAEB0|nr:heptaprenyl diphosphate synthase component 1 [Bacillus sp. FJAT-27225]